MLIKLKSMKNFISVFVIIAAFMVGGCAALGTTNIPYAASVPPEKLCTLRVAPALTVTQFNGAAVTWEAAWGHWGEVKIPEGTHTFILNYSAAHGHATNISFTGNFTAGRTYSMVAQPITSTTVRISIVDGVI